MLWPKRAVRACLHRRVGRNSRKGSPADRTQGTFAYWGTRLNLDARMSAAGHPGKKWDYLISVSDSRRVVAIEPHTATDSDIKDVIQKRRDALAFLKSHLRPGATVHHWLWVSHGPCDFSRTERAKRQLDQEGIEYVGRLIRSLD